MSGLQLPHHAKNRALEVEVYFGEDPNEPDSFRIVLYEYIDNAVRQKFTFRSNDWLHVAPEYMSGNWKKHRQSEFLRIVFMWARNAKDSIELCDWLNEILNDNFISDYGEHFQCTT